MPPRRKKAVEEDVLPGTSEASGLSAASAAPKGKKKTTRVKKAAASEASTVPLLSPEIVSPPRASIDIPIKPITSPLPNISIEPDIQLGEVEERPWTPSPRRDVDLSMPPKPLMQSKKFPTEDVEDILAEPENESDDFGFEREEVRPTVRTGLYRKIAVGFAALALLVGAGVAYVVYAHATVAVFPKKARVATERTLTVASDPKGVDEIAGQVLEVTVAGEKTAPPSTSTKKDGVAIGRVTLINETSSDQTLIPTTRLLTPEGVLFRIKNRVNVPAEGSVTTEVYADQPGVGGDIGPATFTIPGLNASLQKVIYAKSEAPMKGGVISIGTASSEDIEKIESDLRKEMIAQAQAELSKKKGDNWSGEATLAETMSRAVSTAPGETTDGVTVRLTLRVRHVGFDRKKAIDAVTEDLKRGLASGLELSDINGGAASFSVDKADPKAGVASLRVGLTGQSRVSIGSPLFDASKLRGLTLNSVQDYFSKIEGVERVEVVFRPFWIKRMPDLQDHIEFRVEK